MPYSRITSKGQMTIPAEARRKFGFQEGALVVVEETSEGLLLRPAPDIVASAGKLSDFAKVEDVIKDLIKLRREVFR